MYEDEQRCYGRVFGGVVFPGEKPGFAVVVGEENFPIIGNIKLYCYHLLAEAEESNSYDLIRRCTEFRKKYNVDDFYGRLTTANKNLLSHWNEKDRRQGVPEFYIYQAVYISPEGLIEEHLNILRNRLRPEQKLLHLFSDSKLHGYLGELPPDAATKATDLQYPAIASLGYAIATLEFFEPSLEDDDQEDDYRSSAPNPMTGY